MGQCLKVMQVSVGCILFVFNDSPATFHRETLTDGEGNELSPEDIITAAVASGEFASEVGDSGLDVINDNPLEGFEAESSLDCLPGFEASDTECGKLKF